MELTIREIDILIEAMGAWESREAAGDLMRGLVIGMISKDDEDRKKLFHEQEEEKNQRELEKQKEREISILIKAKLIRLKDTITAKEAADFMTK